MKLLCHDKQNADLVADKFIDLRQIIFYVFKSS